MKIDNSLGTYEEVFSTASKEVQRIAQDIHDFIISFDATVCIVPRNGEKSVSYGIGTKKMSESYCYIMPQKDYVNLGFPHGSQILDSNGILEGTGKKYRHVKIKTVDQAKNEAVHMLIEEARAERMRELH